MDLGSLTSGASRQLLELYDEDTRRLITILSLPLIDGVFPTLLVSGALATFSDLLMVSLTIFAGAGALAILYSSSENSREARRMVLKSAPVLVTGAVVVSLIAPVFEQMFSVAMMQTVAGLALLSIALNMFGVEKASNFPVPAIILTGLMLSYRGPESIVFTLEYLQPAVITSLMAVSALYIASSIDHSLLNIDTIKTGGATVIALIAFSQLGVPVPENTPLFVLASSLLVSYRPLKLKTGLVNNQLKLALIQINSARNK